MKKNIKNGFTLVELLAVIVILAIILVIAVPKVMSIIEDAKMGTLESTAKMIASQAEKQKVQNTVLGNDKPITCEGITNINKEDYPSCEITFEDNTAKVTIVGGGKFDGLYVCGGTKTEATAQKESCIEPLQVKHKLFFNGEELTPDKFEVTLTDNDGNTRILENGAKERIVDDESITITSPNWPNNYPVNMTESENNWEYTFEGAVSIQITFDKDSSIYYAKDCVRSCERGDMGYDREECEEYVCDTGKTYISIYDKDGSENYRLKGTEFANETYEITGNYIKITLTSDSEPADKGFSATIKPVYKVPAEYTISPTVAPSSDENFDITISLSNQNLNKKITTNTSHKLTDYIEKLEPFETYIEKNTIKYNDVTYDVGIRYDRNSRNKVYFNCESTDGTNTYGSKNYNYESSCEIWSIIGVFEVEDENGDKEQRVKLVNSNSTFKASWDSSANDVNSGYGINQWGPSGSYEGADLMRLLNGYYIGKENTTCTYCNGNGQETCSQTCTAENLKSKNMKPLTSNALGMLRDAKWDTYATADDYYDYDYDILYLQEKGISAQYTGKSEDDSITRTSNWVGLVGLMSASDIAYFGVCPYDNYIATITAVESASKILMPDYNFIRIMPENTSYSSDIWPSVYLDANVKVIAGNGYDMPYILSIQ